MLIKDVINHLCRKKLFIFKKFSQFCIVSTTSHTVSLQQQITTKALDAFTRHGFKAVTVDEIAQFNGISKKTLYEQFADKDAIVSEAVKLLHTQITLEQDAIIATSKDAIEEVTLIMIMLEDKLKQMNINCFLDLPKYYPQALVDFAKSREVYTKCMVENVKRGIKEGYYRKNLNVDFVSTFRMETMFYFMMNPTSLQKFGFVEMQSHQIQLFLYGICTIKGHALVDEYLTKIKKKRK